MTYNITAKEIYDVLVSNDDIIKIYKKIENREIEDGGWAFHNYEHVKNVTKIAEKILTKLNVAEETIYKCKIACLLHDIGCIKGKEGHAQRSFEYTKELFKEKKWIFDGSDDVLDAIKNHGSGFETNNIICLSIIIADKLDIKKTRITDEGKKIKGNRQYGHIDDIIINIENNTLTINFITDGNIDMKEVSEYYFTAKVFKAIEAFSNKLNLKYNILMDNKIWKLK